MYRFKIANNFPANKEEVTYDELAAACGLSEPSLRRILRALMSQRIFRQSSNGKVSHTLTSKFFADNHIMRQWVGMVVEEMWPAATKVIHSMDG
jgi:DNA-binding IclR family transcriptional regulator